MFQLISGRVILIFKKKKNAADRVIIIFASTLNPPAEDRTLLHLIRPEMEPYQSRLAGSAVCAVHRACISPPAEQLAGTDTDCER